MSSSHDRVLGVTVAELKAKGLVEKAARQRYLMTAPIPEKLRIVEEMRDVTRALRKVREENKARVQAIVRAESSN